MISPHVNYISKILKCKTKTVEKSMVPQAALSNGHRKLQAFENVTKCNKMIVDSIQKSVRLTYNKLKQQTFDGEVKLIAVLTANPGWWEPDRQRISIMASRGRGERPRQYILHTYDAGQVSETSFLRQWKGV